MRACVGGLPEGIPCKRGSFGDAMIYEGSENMIGAPSKRLDGLDAHHCQECLMP